jgi:hypothetical protein
MGKNFQIAFSFVEPLEGVWRLFVLGRNLAKRLLTEIAQNTALGGSRV